MNLEQFSEDLTNDAVTGQKESVDSFISNFKNKILEKDTNFEHCYTQKINSDSNINWNDHSTNKYLEFNLNESEHFSNLNSLTAHVKIQLREFVDNQWVEFKAGQEPKVGLIPGSLLSNLIRNLRVS